MTYGPTTDLIHAQKLRDDLPAGSQGLCGSCTRSGEVSLSVAKVTCPACIASVLWPIWKRNREQPMGVKT